MKKFIFTFLIILISTTVYGQCRNGNCGGGNCGGGENSYTNYNYSVPSYNYTIPNLIYNKDITMPVMTQEQPKVQEENPQLVFGSETEQYSVLVFGAKWCSYCQTMDKNVWSNQEVTSYLKNDGQSRLYMVDVDKSPSWKQHWKVTSLPTTIITKFDSNTKRWIEVERITGDAGQRPVLNLLKKFIPSRFRNRIVSIWSTKDFL